MQITIKPHHFMDIIKLYGAGIEVFERDLNYCHDFYRIGNIIIQQPDVMIKTTIHADDICVPCKYYADRSLGICMDHISHIENIASKDDWNKIIDQRIIETAQIDLNQQYKAAEYCNMLYRIGDNIFDIWREDDTVKTHRRRELFKLGAEKYLGRFPNIL